MSLKTENLHPSPTSIHPGNTEEHPSIELLGAYHRGKLTEGDEDRIQEHFIACADCREMMLELADFLDGVSRPSRWNPSDLVREWRKMRAALGQDDVPSGRPSEAFATRHG